MLICKYTLKLKKYRKHLLKNIIERSSIERSPLRDDLKKKVFYVNFLLSCVKQKLILS